MSDASDLRVSAEQAARQARRLGLWARVVLVPVAAIGAVLSFHSLYTAAVPTFGDYLAAGFPLLVDLLILGASLQYVAGAKIGRPMAGWRLTAHTGVGATLVLNALAAKQVGEIPWHVTAPAVWAVLVELTAKQVLGEWKATHAAKADSISLPLWMTAPIESIRTRLLMFRTGITDAHQARIAVGVNAAAREALRLALPRRNARRVRRIINRQLRAGSLTPVAILRPLGWTRGGVVLQNARPDVILQAVLQEVLDPDAPPAPVVADVAPVAAVMVPQPMMQQPMMQQPMAPQPMAAPQTATVPQQGVELHPIAVQQPAGVTQPMAGAQPVAEAQPVGAAPQPGPVQQPARALQFGRALNRGRAQAQTGADKWATAEDLRMALARVQAPRFEPPRFEPPIEEPIDLFESSIEPPARSAQPAPRTEQLAEQPASRVQPQAEGQARIEPQPARVEQQVQGFPADADLFDETEILEDTEHVSDLDGQEYPDDSPGIQRSDYIDLNQATRQTEPVL